MWKQTIANSSTSSREPKGRAALHKGQPMRILNRVAFLLALVLLVPRGARADNIGIGDTVTFQKAGGTSGGGETIVTANNDPTTSFLSYCIQAGVGSWADFSGTAMVVSGISNYATYVPASQGGDASGRNYLTSQTAWLYTQFREGSLSGFDGSSNAIDSLQWAIWQLQGQMTLPVGMAYSDLANSFIDLSNQAVANGFTGIGNIGVLNLNYLNGKDAQDQLTIVPEPSSLEFLALGAVALFVGRRRFAWRPSEIA
jgi:PEP-CTERM motif